MHTAHFFLTKPSAAGLVQVATQTNTPNTPNTPSTLAAHAAHGLAAEATGANP